MLKHLARGLKDVVSRAKGIEDRNGSGWSAYERLEGLMETFKTQSNESISQVLKLQEEKKEPGINSMGLPILNVKKKT